VFSFGTILIDLSVGEIFAFLSDFKKHMSCWDIIRIPGLEKLKPDTLEAKGQYTMGGKKYICAIRLHLTRPPSGLVTRIQWSNGELAGEWRIREDGSRTRVDLNLEGNGGGLATNVSIQHMNPQILSRLKQHIFPT